MTNIMNSTAFKEARRKAEEKLKELNLTEKIGQLSQFGTSIYTSEEKYFEDHFAEGKIGAYLTIIGAEKTNKVQKDLVEASRLHIPALFGDDVIHGFHTTFPTPLAQSCSWNPEVVRRGCEVAAKEAYRSGIKWTFSPMVDIARDPRWGRVVEGYGEDTYLCSRMSEAAVKGYQGEGETLEKDRVFACMKHFIGYGAAIGGRDYNSAEISDQHLHDVYLPPFAAGIDAGAATVMTAFEDINGTPATANKYILKDVLRDELGFQGMVVSDAGATSELTHHGFAENENDAAIKAFNAGCDMSMQLMGDYYNKGLPVGIKEGRVDENDIDEAVIRVLTLKYLCGIMDDPYTDESIGTEAFSDEHMKATYDAAIECAVLLENDGSLPVKNAKKIALIGALAGEEGKRNLLGPWAGHVVPEKTVTIEEGFRKALGDSAEIVYSYGCSVADDGNENDDSTIAEAVKVANECDTVICVVGEAAGRSGEASSYSNIHLPGNQEKLIDELVKTGKKIILLVSSGRPVILTNFNKKVSALMHVWQMGSMAGAAIADLVLGKVCPSGHLTLSHPRSEGQIPIYYNHYNTGRPLYKTDRWKTCYRDLESSPLYPFGYGLSYTNFEYSDIKLSATEMTEDGEIEVSLNVKNTGECDGAAVVQMYIRDLVGCRVRPVKELKGFSKVFLKAGEEKTVILHLPAKSLAFHDFHMNKIVEPGRFKLWIAESSDDNRYEFDFEVKYSEKKMKVRIGSYNIGDFSGDGLVPGTNEARAAQREVIEEPGAIIWALQEDVEFFGNSDDVYTSIYDSYKNYVRRGNERYNYKALLSNEEIRDAEQVYYSKEIGCRHPWFLAATVTLGKRDVRFINVHFDWSDTVVRTKQIAECIAYACRYENSIIIGDYNPEDCTDGNKNSHLSTYKEDLEAFRAAGFSLANVGEFGIFNTLVHCDMDPCPFDNIAVRGNITIENASIIKKPWMNDHYPIYADIIID